MSRFFLFIVFFSWMFSWYLTTNATTTACTMEYAPVCSWSGGQKQTYSNSCVAKSQWVTDATADACKLIPIDRPIPPILVGDDVDKYGCKPSTGYSWNSILRECVRPWMTKTRIITVLGDTVSCTGVGPMQCLQVKRGLKTELSYSSITGFTPVSGYTYRLLVREDKIENPPADAPSITYSLVRTLSKKLTTGTKDKNLVGTWNLDSYFIDDMGHITPWYTLKITDDSYSIQFCNIINGKYSIKNDKIISPMAMSTKMACFDDTKNMLESAWNLDGAIYTISNSWDKKMMLSIKTKAGSTFVFTK